MGINKDNKLVWVNMGDVSPLEWGSVFVSMDNVCGCFFVLELEVLEGMKQYKVFDCYVDITDSCIDWESVYKFHGVEPNRVKFITDYEKALFAFNYYGYNAFGGAHLDIKSLSDVIEYFDSVGIKL